jgi:hypothetical protein
MDTRSQIQLANAERRSRGLLTLFLAVYGLWCGLRRDQFHWPDALDLPIHETGHIVFGWGGEVVTALGGTLFQLIVPLACVIYFWRRMDRHAASVMLWWVGQNCFNIARYMADARAQDMPLVGGGEHDWAFLLATWRLLPHDNALAYDLRGVAWVIIAISIWLGWFSLQRVPAIESDVRVSNAESVS